MTNRTPQQIEFQACKKRRVVAAFDGGNVSDNGGAPLLREIDGRFRLTDAVAAVIDDARQSGKVQHSVVDMLRQRVFGIALGCEDLNDHDDLRRDLMLQTAVGVDEDLASSPTLCRFENRADRNWALGIHDVLFENYVASFGDEVPEEIVLDFDSTDDLVHGDQDGRFFHKYYDNYCFTPLYVFAGDQLLVSYLRPSNCGEAMHSAAILKLLVRRLRKVWPEVEIVMRADGGFRNDFTMSWCERNDVRYILGMAKNKRLLALSEIQMMIMRAQYTDESGKQRAFCEFEYAAKDWKRKRRVIGRMEHDWRGDNPRYVVTNMEGDGHRLYEKVYCARGEMENRIKEQQLDLFADRTSCHHWWPNQFRLLLASLAYTLLDGIRRIGLKGTEMARAQCGTIRLKLLRIGAVVTRNTRTIRFMLNSACPTMDLFELVAARLKPG